MKLLLLLLSLSLLFVFSSALFPKYPIVDQYKIRSGSSLSPSHDLPNKNYWISPSGNFAFGFYPLEHNDCDHDSSYVIGIWLVKSACKTLVWVANRYDPPLNRLSTILFDYDGKLVLQTKTRKKDRYEENVMGKEKLLFPEVAISASYAKMHDNGNFVLYSFSSRVIWESFDHPTDTILGGQQLHSGQTLRASSSIIDHQGYKRTYWLEIEEYYGILVIRYLVGKGNKERVVTDPLTLNLDPIDGRIYMVDGNDKVLQNITRGDYRRNELDSNIIYRAKLDPDGNLRLYMERFEGEGGESIPLWYSPLRDNTMSTTERLVLWFLVTIFFPSVAALFYVIWPKTDQDFKQRPKDAAAATSPKVCR